MKLILMAVAIFVGCVVSNDVQAQDCSKPSKVVEFKCLSPCDVFKGFGCYLKDATCRTAHGAGMILSAPFKAKMCLPEPQRWIYKPAEWHYKPPVLKRVHPCVPKVKKAPEVRPKPMVFPLYREPPESHQFVKLYELKF
jgi:hypothetical protein